MLRLRVPLVLASQSPRRRVLLRQLGLTFDVRPADTPERWPAGAEPAEAVEHIALEKVRATPAPGSLVLGADTVVVLDGDVLGKPETPDVAAAMLRRLSGRTHTVYTGLALGYRGREVTRHAATAVTFAALSSDEVARYVEAASPLDKAGAYGIQDDLGALLVARVEGEYTNVVGLPLRTLYETVRDDFADCLV